MTLKSAAFLAFIGTALLLILVGMEFVNTLTGVLSDVIPPMKLLACLVYLLGILSVTVFFFVFHKKQS